MLRITRVLRITGVLLVLSMMSTAAAEDLKAVCLDYAALIESDRLGELGRRQAEERLGANVRDVPVLNRGVDEDLTAFLAQPKVRNRQISRFNDILVIRQDVERFESDYRLYRQDAGRLRPVQRNPELDRTWNGGLLFSFLADAEGDYLVSGAPPPHHQGPRPPQYTARFHPVRGGVVLDPVCRVEVSRRHDILLRTGEAAAEALLRPAAPRVAAAVEDLEGRVWERRAWGVGGFFDYRRLLAEVAFIPDLLPDGRYGFVGAEEVKMPDPAALSWRLSWLDEEDPDRQVRLYLSVTLPPDPMRRHSAAIRIRLALTPAGGDPHGDDVVAAVATLTPRYQAVAGGPSAGRK